MSANVKLNLGSKIKILREIRKISQEALAIDIGLSQQAIQQIEAGKTKVDLNRADAIARSLNMDLESLLAFQPANFISNFTQIDMNHKTYFPHEQVMANLENQISLLKEELAFLQNQNTKLLEILASEAKR